MADKLVPFPGVEVLPKGSDLPPPTRPDLNTPSPREQAFVAYLAALDIGYDYATESFTLDGQIESPDILLSKLFERTELRTVVGTANDNTLFRLLSLWQNHLDKQTVAGVVEAMPCYSHLHSQAIEDWLSLACREGDKGKDYSLVMIKQWIWQVRRTLLGLPRWDHVMLVWQGDQEIGKSTSIRNFLAPLSPLWSRWDLAQIVDERHRIGLQRNYAGYVGELSGAKRTELEGLKTILTESHTTLRVMHTHRRMQIEQNCSFIGDTNDRVAQIFKDTENRRFWEIRLKPKGDHNAHLVRDFPGFHDFWGAVDPYDNTSPLEASGLRNEIRTAQTAELGTRTSVQEWLYEAKLSAGDVKIPSAELYAAFKKWANPLQLYTGNSQWFGRELTDRIPRARGRVGSYNGNYYLCNRDVTK